MKDSLGRKIFKIINTSIIVLFIFLTVYPFLQVVAESFSSEAMIRAGHVNLIPRGFNVNTYRALMSDNIFWLNYRNTLIITVASTALSMFMTTTAAYTLSKKDLAGRSFLLFLFAFTMFFGGGIIPNFILINNFLGWDNNLLAVIVPGALGIFNLLIMKTFFENLPKELEEAAAIDGLNQYGIFFKIVLPLSKAVIATQILFFAVGNWNAWFGAFLFISDRTLQPVAMYLRNLISAATALTAEHAAAGAAEGGVNHNVGAVAMVLVTAPIICSYPFAQKHFVAGVTLGSVK